MLLYCYCYLLIFSFLIMNYKSNIVCLNYEIKELSYRYINMHQRETCPLIYTHMHQGQSDCDYQKPTAYFNSCLNQMFMNLHLQFCKVLKLTSFYLLHIKNLVTIHAYDYEYLFNHCALQIIQFICTMIDLIYFYYNMYY